MSKEHKSQVIVLASLAVVCLGVALLNRGML